MVETLAELPFIGDQVVCLSHDQAGPPGNDCVAVASEHGFALWAARGGILQGWADAQRGQATTGIVRIRHGLAAAEATGDRSTTPVVLTLLAEALAFAGRIEEALAALDDALAKAA